MSEEQSRPKNQDVSVFDKTLRGFHGEFKSNSSYPLSFIQSAISVGNINILQTASEAFNLESLDFEELMQRDIDSVRVKKIVEQYLLKGKDRVLFFPPLLVSLIATENNSIIPTYESVEHVADKKRGELISTWGKDRFQLIMPYSDEATGHSYSTDDGDFDSNPYWSILKVNSNKISMVVIDGQHRLSALKYLANSKDEEHKRVLENISIPICVLYSPDAIKENEGHETISRDLRELFVRINMTAKEVSGHFTALLDDKSLSSFTIREFCEICKNEKFTSGLNLLNLIEWNQRENKIASQVNRKYSITTIRIIFDTIKEFIFHEKSGGKTKQLLELTTYSDELKAANDVGINDISEDNFSPGQIDILKNIIETKLAKSLKILFSKAKPYSEIIDSFEKSTKALDLDIKNKIKGSFYFKNDVLGQFRDVNEFDTSASKDARDKFLDGVDVSNDIKVFTSNVFQQGMIRVWIEFSYKLLEHGISLENTAEALVLGLNNACFDTSYRIFDNDRMYSQKLLFNGARYIVSKRSKTNWKRLITATFLQKRARSEFIKSIKNSNPKCDLENISAYLEETATKNLIVYLEELKSVVRVDYINNWADKEFTAQVTGELESLSIKKQNDKDAEKAFNEIIDGFTEARLKEAEDKLTSVLGL